MTVPEEVIMFLPDRHQETDFSKLVYYDDLSGYTYRGTVVVEGDLRRYVVDLEAYLSESWKRLETEIRRQKEDLAELRDDIRQYEEGEEKRRQGRLPPLGYHIFSSPYGGIDDVDRDNYRQVEARVVRELHHQKALLRSHKINRGKVVAVLEGEPLETMDLFNYSHRGYIVHIQGRPNCLTMQVFVNPMQRPEGDYVHNAGGFATHAHTLEGVRAKLVREEQVDRPVPASVYAASGKPRRSKPVVHPLPYELGEGDFLTYSITLGLAEREMLNKIIQHDFNCPRDLYYTSPLWSPHQGRPLLKGLFGVVGVYDGKANRHRPHWSNIFVPEENTEAVKRALAGGQFWKEYQPEDLPVLQYVAERTVWIEKKYHKRHLPRFSPTEIGNILGWEKARAKQAIARLTGVLAAMDERYALYSGNFLWRGTARFYALPHARREMAEEMLEQLE